MIHTNAEMEQSATNTSVRTLSVVLFLFLSGLPAAVAADRVTTSATPNNGQPMHAVCTADGAIHLLYEENNQPFYVKSIDNGATFGAAIPLVDEASKKSGLEFNVWDMAAGQNGQVYAVLGNNAWKLKLPKTEWGLFFTTIEPNAKQAAPLRNINHEPSEGFSIASDGKGNVALFWLKGKVFYSLSRDGGKNFSPGAELNPSYNPCPCCTTAATYGLDGKLACIYREQTNEERDIYMVLLTATGQQTRQKVSTTPWKVNSCPMTYFNVSPAKDGFTAAWPTKGEIYFARFGNDGKIVSPGEIKTVGRSGMRCGIVTLNAPSGDTLVAWNSDGKLGWEIVDTKGMAGERGTSETRGKGVAAVVTKDGSFIVFR
jgi:hypothetical protein